MGFKIAPMQAIEARAVCQWCYEGILSFYDGEGDATEYIDHGYYSVFENEEWLGFYCFGSAAQVPGHFYDSQALDFGLGLHLDRVGQRLGRAFIERGMRFAREALGAEAIRLSVARFNETAARLYASLGFEWDASFVSPGGHEFLVMRKSFRRIVDITRPLTEGMAVYSGHEAFHIQTTRTIAADQYNLSHISMGVHCGTHMDAPTHFVEGGLTIDAAPLELLTGRARVVTRRDGEGYEDIPFGTRRLIVRSADYAGVTLAEADALIARGVRLIGTDRMSVARDGFDLPVHVKLLSAGVWILETLDLSEALDGEYHLTCMPLKIAGSEGAPTRAILEAWA